MTTPPTGQQLDLDAIETRAAHLHEYATLTDVELQSDADDLFDIDVPALAREVRRLRAELVSIRSETMREAADIVLKTIAPADWDADSIACWNTALNIAEHELRQRVAPPSAASPTAIADADNPTPLRWGLDDVLWGDDDSVTILMSGPDREPYWLELDPERAAGLRQNLAGPDGGPRRALTASEYNTAWHAVEGAAGEEGADPGTVLHAVLDRLGIAWQDAAYPPAAARPSA